MELLYEVQFTAAVQISWSRSTDIVSLRRFATGGILTCIATSLQHCY
jgi:hypothetical protein